MFFSLAKTESEFHKKLKSKLISLVGLANRTAAFFYDDFRFYYVNLDNMACLFQGQLKGNVYRTVAISPFQIIVSVIQTKSFIKINFKQRSQTQIFQMTVPLNYNLARQKQKFFLSSIEAFKETSSFYIKQQIHEQRRFRIFYFPNKDKNQYQLFQFPSKDQLIERLDDDSSISVYNQTSTLNGMFNFTEYNLKDRDVKIQYRLENNVFLVYSSIIQIKRLKDDKFLIGLNSNQKQHLIIFNKFQVNSTFYQSDQLLISSIFLNIAQDYGVFMFMSHQNPIKNDIRMINLSNGQLICQATLQIKDYSVSFNSQYVLNYMREAKPTTETYIYTIHFIQKKIHFMKVLQELSVGQTYGCQFYETVLNFLK